MSKIVRCDRCGLLQESPEDAKCWGNFYDNVGTNKDLCPGCVDELNMFLSGRPMHGGDCFLNLLTGKRPT